MITISKIYKPNKEFKQLYRTLRTVNRIDSFYLITDNRENEFTYFIDRFIDRCKKLEISKDTYNKLHRFAIAYRHNALQGTK